MIFSILPVFTAPLTSQTAYDNAVNTVRGMIFEVTSIDKALTAAASEPIASFGDSGTLPNVINGLCNLTGYPLEEIKTRKIETIGDAANFIIDRG
jgi:hypothetical protein